MLGNASLRADLCSMNLSTPLGRFRLIALAEGISFLLLIFIAMPLKYLAGWPYAVKYVGWAHGLLFVLYCFALLQVWVVQRWSFWKAAWAFLLSFIPFGTFYLDKTLKNEEAALA